MARSSEGFADGGPVEGHGGILVQLDNSYIVSKSDVEKYGGLDAFKALNLGEIPNAKS